MPDDEKKLPPELWKMIAAHLNLTCILRLTMSSSYLASALAFDAHRNWEVDCCRAANDEIYNQPSKFTYRTSLNSFFKALKCGLAPAFAERVVFDFCRHCEPIRKQTQKRLLDKPDWPLENAAKLLHALNASEIVMSVRDVTRPSHICNEPLFNVLLRESIQESSNATVKLRILEPVQRGGYNHFYKIISTPLMSRTLVASNVQLVSSPTTLRVSGSKFWEAVEFESNHGITTNISLNDFPSIKCITARDPIYISRSFLENFRRDFRYCQQLVVTTRNTRNKSLSFRSGTTYYFDSVSEVFPSGRSCRKISVHMPLREWAKVLDVHTLYLWENVRILEIHHTDEARNQIAHPVVLKKFLLTIMRRLLSLEVMTFKVENDALKDTVHCLPLIEDQVLTESFCHYCKQYTFAIKMDVKAVRARLNITPYYGTIIERLELIDEICKK